MLHVKKSGVYHGARNLCRTWITVRARRPWKFSVHIEDRDFIAQNERMYIGIYWVASYITSVSFDRMFTAEFVNICSELRELCSRRDELEYQIEETAARLQ